MLTRRSFRMGWRRRSPAWRRWWSVSVPAARADDKVVVFAAASLKNALDNVNAAWKADTGKEATISYAASSALAKQIEGGAPADIFISADLDWMKYLSDKKLTKPDTEVKLLGNRIVLVAPKDSKARDHDRARISTWPGCSATASSPWATSRRCRPANTARRRSNRSASGPRSKARWRRPKTCAPR